VDAPAGLAATDRLPAGQRVRQLADQLFVTGLATQLIDQRMTGRRQSPSLASRHTSNVRYSGAVSASGDTSSTSDTASCTASNRLTVSSQ
jgi:hypothetical protein